MKSQREAKVTFSTVEDDSVPPPPPEYEPLTLAAVTLTMTGEQAIALYAITQHISGSNQIREAISPIGVALQTIFYGHGNGYKVADPFSPQPVYKKSLTMAEVIADLRRNKASI